MKRLAILVAAALIFCSVPGAAAGDWGVGGFAGINVPIEQEDAENGMVYGIKGRWSPFWSLAIEPQVFLLQNGDYDIEFGDGADESETLKGWKATSFGANLVLGAPASAFSGVRPFVFGGLRFNSMDFEGRDAETKLGFAAGIGLEIGFSQVGLEIRGTGEVFTDGEKSSRKNGTITGGLNVYFGP